MTQTLSLAQARSLWWSRQAIGGTGDLVTTVSRSGWLRTLGGTDAYVAARARHAGMARGELDRAVDAGQLRVVPAARGCIYLIPGELVADVMAANTDDWTAKTEKDLKKLGKTMKLVETLAAEVRKTVATGALTTDAIRKQIDVPSFGEAGKKIGLSSPLPLALRLLELRGQVERVLEGGRLDSTSYAWREPKGKAKPASKDPVARMVRAFLGFAGPATLGQIAAWSGRAQRDLKPILGKLEAVAVEVEGLGEAWVRHEDVADLTSVGTPSGCGALAFEDNFLVNHGLAAVTEPRHHGIECDIWGPGKGQTIGEATSVLSRTLVLDGVVVGFWEVDPRTRGAVSMTFDKLPKAKAAVVAAAADDMARFLLEDLGHARSFTLDTMDLVQQRADRVAKLGRNR